MISIFTVATLLSAVAFASQLNVVPLPKTYSVTGAPVFLSTPFTCQTTSKSTILQDACKRYMTEIIFNKRPESTPKNGAPNMLKVNVASDDESGLQLGMDETYTLTTGASNVLTAKSVWGALRGLETFSQLVVYNFSMGLYQIQSTSIDDAPRFQHRALMTDIVRHFETPHAVRRLIEAMSYAKYNTLHMHLSDDQAFPVEVKSSPLLWTAAYSNGQKMSVNDLVDIVAFAKSRGIRVIFEFDMPGHARSWCKGYPSVCPSPSCDSPLDPSNNFTFEVIDKLIGEYITYFPDDFIHLGGDEVNTGCYSKVPHVAAWLKKNNFTANDGYKYFVKRAHDIGHIKHGKNVIQWVEVFDNFGTQLAKDTVVHVWKAKTTLQSVVKAGYRAILSDNDIWYLDNLGRTWQDMYMNEPFQNITDSAQQKLILGGELCMWGETVDPSDLDQTVWPRSAAGAERLWSPMNVNDVSQAQPRLQTFRCLLNQRGIAAAPLNNKEARQSPPGPGSCLTQ